MNRKQRAIGRTPISHGREIPTHFVLQNIGTQRETLLYTRIQDTHHLAADARHQNTFATTNLQVGGENGRLEVHSNRVDVDGNPFEDFHSESVTSVATEYRMFHFKLTLYKYIGTSCKTVELIYSLLHY